MSHRCGLCGHDPACGLSYVTRDPDDPGDRTQPIYLCHTDDHSCYNRWMIHGERPQRAQA